MVSDSNSRAYQLALRIKALLELRHQVTNDEVVYLTMHVARLETGMRTRA